MKIGDQIRQKVGFLSRIPSEEPVRTLGDFFGVVLELARPSEPWCFPAGS